MKQSKKLKRDQKIYLERLGLNSRDFRLERELGDSTIYYNVPQDKLVTLSNDIREARLQLKKENN